MYVAVRYVLCAFVSANHSIGKHTAFPQLLSRAFIGIKFVE